jgi:hypothetical protein
MGHTIGIAIGWHTERTKSMVDFIIQRADKSFVGDTENGRVYWVNPGENSRQLSQPINRATRFPEDVARRMLRKDPSLTLMSCDKVPGGTVTLQPWDVAYDRSNDPRFKTTS